MKPRGLFELTTKFSRAIAVAAPRALRRAQNHGTLRIMARARPSTPRYQYSGRFMRSIRILSGEGRWTARTRKTLPLKARAFALPERCLTWVISSIATLIIAATTELSIYTILFILLAFYGIESFITEVFGVSVDDAGIAVPNRLIPSNPWIVFWRKRFEWKDIERVCSLSDRRIQLISVNMRAHATFGTRDEKLEFFRAVRKFRPSIRIQKKPSIRDHDT